MNTFIIVLEWVTAVLTIAAIWLTGTKWKYAPILSLVTFLFWGYIMFEAKKWGLFACEIALFIISIRNSILWIKDERRSKLYRIKKVAKLLKKEGWGEKRL